MNKDNDDLRKLRMFGLTLLQLMGLLAFLGIVITLVLKWFAGS